MPFTVYSPIRRIHHFMDKHLELTKQLVKLKKADILMVIFFFYVLLIRLIQIKLVKTLISDVVMNTNL